MIDVLQVTRVVKRRCGIRQSLERNKGGEGPPAPEGPAEQTQEADVPGREHSGIVELHPIGWPGGRGGRRDYGGEGQNEGTAMGSCPPGPQRSRNKP